MKFALTLFAALALLPASVPAQTLAEKLTVLSGASMRDDTTVRRFEFLLDEFKQKCKLDDPRLEAEADVLVYIQQEIEAAGLDEGLLDLANTLHRLTSDFIRVLGTEDAPNCIELWSVYLVQRRSEGRSPSEAHAFLVQVISP